MDEQQETKPQLWALRWIRDESFWRDIATKVISALVVLLVGFLWASASGWLGPSKQAGARWGAVGIAALLAVMAALYVWIIVVSSKEMERREGTGRRYAIGLTLLMAAQLAVVTVPFIIGLASGTMFGQRL